MEKTKKIIIITLICILILITVLVIFLSSREEEQPVTNNNPNNEITQKNYFKKVSSYNEFFSIQNTLNNNSNELNTSYIIQELYINRIGQTKYYFVNCSKLESDIGAETINYQKNNYYLMIVNSNRYQLSKLNNVNDLESYAKNYQVVEKQITSNDILQKGYTEEEIILTLYIEYFKDMLILDTELAYYMLDETTKKQYSNYNDFYNQVIDIYNKLSSKIFGYNKQENDETNIYNVEDDNRNKIVITESGIMDFKISY